MPDFIVCDNEIYRRGTLAQRLDKRACPRTEPQARDIPATINPMKFMLEHVFGNRLSIIRIQQKCMNPEIPFLFSLWKWFQSPEQRTLLVFEMTPQTEVYHARENSSLALYPLSCSGSDSVTQSVTDEASVSTGRCN